MENRIEAFAEESPQLKRAREKLKKTFQKNIFSKDELEKKVNQIKDKIDRETRREIITNKSFTHFDNNQNPAPISEKVFEVAKRLSCQLELDAKD